MRISGGARLGQRPASVSYQGAPQKTLRGFGAAEMSAGAGRAEVGTVQLCGPNGCCGERLGHGCGGIALGCSSLLQHLVRASASAGNRSLGVLCVPQPQPWELGVPARSNWGLLCPHLPCLGSSLAAAGGKKEVFAAAAGGNATQNRKRKQRNCGIGSLGRATAAARCGCACWHAACRGSWRWAPVWGGGTGGSGHGTDAGTQQMSQGSGTWACCISCLFSFGVASTPRALSLHQNTWLQHKRMGDFKFSMALKERQVGLWCRRLSPVPMAWQAPAWQLQALGIKLSGPCAQRREQLPELQAPGEP